MEQVLGAEWKVTPIIGGTGETYIAETDGQKLFIKRNSSPFLAVLSAEGIVPRLVWTRRLSDGDVITAQHWVDGRCLEEVEMSEQRVASLLRKIHQSSELVMMLMRLGKDPLLPSTVLTDLQFIFPSEIHDQVSDFLAIMEADLSAVYSEELAVCQCDIHYNNWIVSNNQELYLIDWDGATIADPAMDVGMLLYLYVSRENWESWLETYGVEATDSFLLRMRWYVLAQTLTTVAWHYYNREEKELQQALQFLRKIA